jgi:hypothetical protein
MVMRALETATVGLHRPKQESPSRLVAQRMRNRCCSDFVEQRPAQTVLFVGAERWDEFAQAIDLASCGHDVTVVNPRKSLAARAFQAAGGSFVQSMISKLPSTLGPFDIVCEHYPFTITRVRRVCERNPCTIWRSLRALRAYAMPRLRQLVEGGRWVIFTESPGLPKALHLLVQSDPTLRRNFTSQILRLNDAHAPSSKYPILSTRFLVILRRARHSAVTFTDYASGTAS